jgi:hypothetical protein
VTSKCSLTNLTRLDGIAMMQTADLGELYATRPRASSAKMASWNVLSLAVPLPLELRSRRRGAGGAAVFRAHLYAGIGPLSHHPRSARRSRAHRGGDREAAEGRPLPPVPANYAAPDVADPGVTVAQLLTPTRRKRTILLWIVSFCFL